LEISQEDLKQMIESAVEAKAQSIRSSIEAEIESLGISEKQAYLSKAASEGSVLHTDPGNGYEFAVINLSKIEFNEYSRRTPDELDPETDGIKELATEIKAKGGLVRPLLVYRKDDGYVLVKGARRLVALRSMGEELTHAYILPAKPPFGIEDTWVNGY
jgi:hypothetical protein